MKDTQKAGVLAVVRRMIDRNLENKVIGNAVETNVSHNSAISAADCEPLIPQIEPIDSAAGNTAQQRMGDRIKPKSLTVKGVLAVRPDAGTIQNFLVRVVILAQKNLKVGSAVLGGGVDADRLLRPAIAGVGTDQIPYSGNTIEVGMPINTDLFRVYYDKTFKLSASIPSADGASMPQASTRWSYKFKQGKMPAQLTFDEGNGNWANNFAPFVAVGYAYADGTAPDAVVTKIRSNIFSQFVFEDA